MNLRNDIAVFAQGARKERRVLQHGRSKRLEAKKGAGAEEGIVKTLGQRMLAGQLVMSAAHQLMKVKGGERMKRVLYSEKMDGWMKRCMIGKRTKRHAPAALQGSGPPPVPPVLCLKFLFVLFLFLLFKSMNDYYVHTILNRSFLSDVITAIISHGPL